MGFCDGVDEGAWETSCCGFLSVERRRFTDKRDGAAFRSMGLLGMRMGIC